MTESIFKRLSQVTRDDGMLHEYVANFGSRVSRSDFPCIFAAKTLIHDEVVVAVTEEKRPDPKATYSAIRDAAQVLSKDLSLVAVLFVNAGVFSEPQDEIDFCRAVLNLALKEQRAVAPAHLRLATADPQWTLVVDGLEIFLNISSPNHAMRKSRNLGPVLTFVIQWRGAFDAYPGNHPSRASIRSRLKSYDGMAPHPALGAFGAPGNRELEQYYLGDLNEVTVFPAVEDSEGFGMDGTGQLP